MATDDSGSASLLIRGIDRFSSGKLLNATLRSALQKFGLRNVIIRKTAHRRIRNGCAVVVMASRSAAQQAISELHATGIPYESTVLTLGYATGDKRDHLFPYVDYPIRRQLQLDTTAVFSVTDQNSADRITSLVAEMLRAVCVTEHDDDGQVQATITDAMACVGGNALSFAQIFAHVNAVEIDTSRAAMLRHNVAVCEQQERIDVQNEDYLTVASSLQQDVVFFDPPWGGTDYSAKDVITDLRITDAVSLRPLMLQSLQLPNVAIVIAKLPGNFDVESLCAAFVTPGAASGVAEADMERPAPFMFNFGATKVVAVAKRTDRFRFCNGTLDAVIKRVFAWDVALGKEHQPAFYDWEKRRFIVLAKWKGCKLH